MRTVRLLRAVGNRLLVDPTPDDVRPELEAYLSYVAKEGKKGDDRLAARRAGRSVVVEVPYECFVEDFKGRIVTSLGFYLGIKKILKAAGYAVEMCWATRREAAEEERRLRTVYRPDWKRLKGEKFRLRQKEALELIANPRIPCGRISCPPAWGKSTLIRMAAELLPRAKIAVVARPKAVVMTRLYPELCQALPDVGLVTGGEHRKGCRVTCYTAGSLHHADPKTDYVFFDEVHQAASDDCAGKLGVFEHARMWGLSASHERADNKHKRCEAMFGPMRLVVSYKTAQAAGIVSPLEVVWRDVVMDENPASGAEYEERKKLGIWTNDYRNDLIAQDARRYGADVQVLIIVDTMEHALHLKKRLPDFKLAYSPQLLASEQGRRRMRRLAHEGLVPEDFRLLDDRGLTRMAERFSKGRLKKVIATPVWNIGVDFKLLQVLIRADGTSTPTNDIQIPGRNSRVNDRGKEVGIIHDYLDQFDPGLANAAARRRTSYEKQGWAQVLPGDRPEGRSRVRSRMGWGDPV